ncbi:MAG: 30S ribosomal protein S16 [bacterium]|nr:30S ribosomal protein S16 [bacterium]
MLKIRLQRIGRKNMPAFRIIVAEHTRGPKTGNIVEKVGTYNPKTKERTLEAERIKYWLSVGAQASGTVHNMLVSAKIITGEKVEKHQEKPPAPAEAKTAEGGSPDSSQGEESREAKAEVKTEESVPAPVAEEVKTEEKAEVVEAVPQA